MWHFPVFVFSKYYVLEQDMVFKLSLIVAIIFISVLSFNFVEKPFRSAAKVSTRNFLFITLTALMALSTAAAATIYFDGFKNRDSVGKDAKYIENYEPDNGRLRKERNEHFLQ